MLGVRMMSHFVTLSAHFRNQLVFTKFILTAFEHSTRP